MSDHYHTLGLPRGAGDPEIRRAFRAIARTCHPDASSDPADHARFLEAKEAYETLSNPTRRAAYDRVLRLREERDRATQQYQRPRVTASYDNRRVQPQQPKVQSVDPSQVLEMSRQMSQRRFDDARRTAKRLLERDPTYPMAQAVLADIARANGDIKIAAAHYAKAAQYAPEKPDYMRKHEQMLDLLTKGEVPLVTIRPFPIVAGGMMLTAMAAYLLLAQHGVLFSYEALRLAISAPLLSMWIVGGATLGATLAQSGAFDDFRGQAGGAARPALALTAMALISFWLAAAMLVFVDVRQGSANRSLLTLVVGVGTLNALFALCATTVGLGGPALLWGGNAIYPCALVGWAATDAIRRRL